MTSLFCSVTTTTTSNNNLAVVAEYLTALFSMSVSFIGYHAARTIRTCTLEDSCICHRKRVSKGLAFSARKSGRHRIPPSNNSFWRVHHHEAAVKDERCQRLMIQYHTCSRWQFSLVLGSAGESCRRTCIRQHAYLEPHSLTAGLAPKNETRTLPQAQ